MPSILRALLASWLLALALLLAQPELMPVDEGPSDPEFFDFRAQLQMAVARRDLPAILAALDPQVKLSFGDASGIDDFKTIWRPEVADSPLWAELGSTLALGGTFDEKDEFIAPCVFSRWPAGVTTDLMMRSCAAILAPRVPVRATPQAVAAELGTLHFAVIEIEGGDEPWAGGWSPIKLPGNRKGFIEDRFLHSLLGYRVHLSKQSGQWLIDAFLRCD